MSNARDKANIPALNFSSTGIDDNATSTAITINSSENVLVGDTSVTDASSSARVYSKTGYGIITNNNENAGGIKLSSSSTNALIFQADPNNQRASTEMYFYTDGSERMKIDTSYNLLVGDSSVTDASNGAKVYSKTGFGIITNNNENAGGVRLVSSSQNSVLVHSDPNNQRADSFIGFNVDGTRAMHIDDSFNVGIGTTSPDTKLHVADNIKGDGNFSLGTLPSGASSSSYRQAQISLANFSDSGGNNSATFWHQNGYIGSGNNSYAVTSGTGTSHASRLGMSSGVLTYNNAYPVTADTTISFSERFRIASNGNVGIGTSSPSGKLDVNGSIYCDGLQVDGNVVIQQATGDVSLTLAANENGSNREPSFNLKGYNSSSNPIINFGDNSGYPGKIEYENQDNSMRLYTNSSERMRINSDGALIINNADYNAIFNVKGAGWVTSSETTAGTNSAIVYFSKRSSNGIQMRFQQSSTTCGDITTSGSSVSYGSNSDYRLKENVVEMTNATTRLKQLQPKRFNFIADADTTIDGFLAHEVQSVVPEAITGTHNEVEVWKEGEELPEGVSVGDNKLDGEGNTIPVYQGIDQAKLVPLLVKTIQELEARITALETNQP